MSKANSYINEHGELVIEDSNNNPKKKTFIVSVVVVVLVVLIAIVVSVSQSAGTGSTSSFRSSSPRPVTETTDIKNNCARIRNDIESQLHSISFEKGSIYSPSEVYDTWLMSAEMTDLRLGNRAYLSQNSEGNYTQLFVPVYFTLHINETVAFAEDTLEDMVGYWQITGLLVNSKGELEYSSSGMSSTYFTSEDVLLSKGLSVDNNSISTISFY